VEITFCRLAAVIHLPLALNVGVTLAAAPTTGVVFSVGATDVSFCQTMSFVTLSCQRRGGELFLPDCQTGQMSTVSGPA